MLNDYTERKDAYRSHHSQLVEFAGLRGLWRSGLGYCRVWGRVWGFISTVTASSFETPADIPQPVEEQGGED